MWRGREGPRPVSWLRIGAMLAVAFPSTLRGSLLLLKLVIRIGR